MSDNTIINPGSGGDTIRTVDRTTAKTQVMQLDVGGDTPAGAVENLVTSASPLPVLSPTDRVQTFLLAQMLAQSVANAAASGGGFVPVETPDFLLGG